MAVYVYWDPVRGMNPPLGKVYAAAPDVGYVFQAAASEHMATWTAGQVIGKTMRNVPTGWAMLTHLPTKRPAFQLRRYMGIGAQPVRRMQTRRGVLLLPNYWSNEVAEYLLDVVNEVKHELVRIADRNGTFVPAPDRTFVIQQFGYGFEPHPLPEVYRDVLDENDLRTYYEALTAALEALVGAWLPLRVASRLAGVPEQVLDVLVPQGLGLVAFGTEEARAYGDWWTYADFRVLFVETKEDAERAQSDGLVDVEWDVTVVRDWRSVL